MSDILRLANPIAGQGVLSGRLLRQEALLVDAQFYKLLDQEDSITLSLDGWSNCRMKSLYGFVAITSGRKTHLLSLQDLSAESHTASYLAGKLGI